MHHPMASGSGDLEVLPIPRLESDNDVAPEVQAALR